MNEQFEHRRQQLIETSCTIRTLPKLLHLKEAVIALDTALLDNPELPGFNHPKITIDQNRTWLKD